MSSQSSRLVMSEPKRRMRWQQETDMSDYFNSPQQTDSDMRSWSFDATTPVNVTGQGRKPNIERATVVNVTGQARKPNIERAQERQENSFSSLEFNSIQPVKAPTTLLRPAVNLTSRNNVDSTQWTRNLYQENERSGNSSESDDEDSSSQSDARSDTEIKSESQGENVEDDNRSVNNEDGVVEVHMSDDDFDGPGTGSSRQYNPLMGQSRYDQQTFPHQFDVPRGKLENALAAKNNELQSLREQHALLQELLTQQEQLKKLKDQHSALLALQETVQGEMSTASTDNQQALTEPQKMQQIIEVRRKLEKLEEVKNRLSQLKELVHYYQSSAEAGREQRMAHSFENGQLSTKLSAAIPSAVMERNGADTVVRGNVDRQSAIVERGSADRQSVVVERNSADRQSVVVERNSADRQSAGIVRGNVDRSVVVERNSADRQSVMIQRGSSNQQNVAMEMGSADRQSQNGTLKSTVTNDRAVQSMMSSSVTMNGTAPNGPVKMSPPSRAGMMMKDVHVDQSDTMSDLSSEFGAWGDDPDVREKVRRLKEAKEKLRRLQSLITIVHSSSDNWHQLPDDLANLAANLDEELKLYNIGGNDPADDRSTRLQPAVSLPQPARQAQTRLELLVAEKRRMRSLQKDLEELRSALPALALGSGSEADSKKTGGAELSRPDSQQRGSQAKSALETAQVTFGEPLETVITNEELYGQMRQQRILREELREKKKELEKYMKKDRPRKHYSRNQDNQSDNVSYSNKSDQFGASASEDITMATWGGSTAGNMESIEEDGEAPNIQHQDDDDDDDDDGYPSDGIVQVEEEEELHGSDHDTYTIEDAYGKRIAQRAIARYRRKTAPNGSRKSAGYSKWASGYSSAASRKKTPPTNARNASDWRPKLEEDLSNLKSQVEYLTTMMQARPDTRCPQHGAGMHCSFNMDNSWMMSRHSVCPAYWCGCMRGFMPPSHPGIMSDSPCHSYHQPGPIPGPSVQHHAHLSGPMPGPTVQQGSPAGGVPSPRHRPEPDSSSSDVGNPARNQPTTSSQSATTAQGNRKLKPLSKFEVLRENIYAEVATLISRNEDHPHFLLELFQELQRLDSDYLRQMALYAIQELVSSYLTEDNMDGKQMTMLQTKMPATSTPSGQPYVQQGAGDIDAESMQSDKFDYAENVDMASSLSTPSSSNQNYDNPFAEESLGQTVIHLDTALRQMRDYELKIIESAEGEDDMTTHDNQGEAQDHTSDGSVSDMPHAQINTCQLDVQIKTIMEEIVPVLKEHINDVCSQQLLLYVKRLVLLLTKQHDDQQENVKFFQGQLGSIVQESLAKFEGRRLRECGEDLLVDLSEILFNELAFFRLMQDLDDPKAKVKASLQQWAEAPDAATEFSGNEDLQNGDSPQMKIELAPSESKPYSRIGSDEDDEGEDEAANNEEPSDTAVAMDAQNSSDDYSGDDEKNSSRGSVSDPSSAVNVEYQPTSGATSSSEASQEDVKPEDTANSDMAGEITFEDVPVNLQSVSQNELKELMSSEQAMNNIAQEALGLVDVAGELAGDPEAILPHTTENGEALETPEDDNPDH